MFQAAKGDIVKILYVGKLTSGEIFDASPEDRPLEFIIGKQEVIQGMEEAVVGMVFGEKRTVTIPADKAYGQVKPERIEEVERSILPEGVDLRVGGRLQVTKQDGSEFMVKVVALTDETVTLDANHPLAGQDLVFDIHMLEVKRVTKPK